ncbi:MAG: 50S ribosomal protein L9 [Candidatus Paceibacterota bacterium]|jgi:large subunit ribosomal protein L9
MKVILKENIKGVGRKYEIKNISDGYANNFLIPKKLAEYASPEAVKKAEILRATVEAEIQIQEKLTQKQIEMLKGVKIVLNKKASEKGHLFEKVQPEEIAAALKDQAKIDIGSEFLMIEKPVKEVGEHAIIVQIGKNRGEFKLVIEAEK